jgi:hypothetical protein
MALSPNYGWAEPDNSSLVKNGAQDIRALGDAIDTSVWNVGYGQAGKNKIINGDFGIWQRGTSFQLNLASSVALADRWQYLCDDGANIKTFSQQTFTPGTAPIAGYEGTYFMRIASATASATETYSLFTQYIEDVRTFAGQTITISFWAKAAANTTMPSVAIRQNFGSGGSTAVDTNVTTNIAVTTSWQRFSYSVAVPSVSGKTIGANSYLRIGLFNPTQATFTLDFWGVQVEYGSKATPFQTATGTIQGELAACQRYYYRMSNSLAYEPFGLGYGVSATRGNAQVKYATTLRTNPSSLDFANLALYDGASTVAVTNLTLDTGTSKDLARLAATTASGITQFRPYELLSNNSTSAYIGFSAEL